MIIPMETLNSLTATPCVPEMFGNMTIQEIHYFIDNFEGEAWGGCKNKKEKIEVAIQVFGRGQHKHWPAFFSAWPAQSMPCVSAVCGKFMGGSYLLESNQEETAV